MGDDEVVVSISIDVSNGRFRAVAIYGMRRGRIGRHGSYAAATTATRAERIESATYFSTSGPVSEILHSVV
jgi:hypothetical protein